MTRSLARARQLLSPDRQTVVCPGETVDPLADGIEVQGIHALVRELRGRAATARTRAWGRIQTVLDTAGMVRLRSEIEVVERNPGREQDVNDRPM